MKKASSSAKIARSKKPAPARKAAKTKAAATTKPMSRRADYGAPIQAFFDKQPPALRVIVNELRALIEAAAPHATASIKWGMPA